MSRVDRFFLLPMSLDTSILLPMDKDDFNRILNELNAKHNALVDRRAALQVEIGELDNQIAVLKKTMLSMSPLMGMTLDPNDLTGMGITDAIRKVLMTSRERMAPSQVKDALLNKGFDLSGYGNPMASIYKVLTRLKESNQVIAEQEGWNVFYRWKHRKRRIRVRKLTMPVAYVEEEQKK